MKKLFFFAFLFACLFSRLLATESYILHCRNAGLFSIFKDVTCILINYDMGCIRGVSINFGKTGYYYDKNYGENWWEYYFEPICLGEMIEPIRYTCSGNVARIHLSDIMHCEVVQKYVHLKPHLQEKLDAFIKQNFDGYYIIGVHYRGTDKKIEAGRVSYDKMLLAISKQVDKAIDTCKKWKIFLATDEQDFLDTVVEKYEKAACYIDAYRAKDGNSSPMHLAPNRSPYQQGESAILDCLLLSRSDFMLRTNHSNLSHCCLFFNPKLENLEINP